MAIEHHFYMNTSAHRHTLRDVLINAGIGMEAEPDMEARPELPDISGAFSQATLVTLLDDLSDCSLRPDNGVLATRCISFRDCKLYLDDPDNPMNFSEQTVQGVMALLRACPDADAYWEGWDARVPLLLRRHGRLVLSEQQAEPGRFWDPDRQALQALVDLPYTVEPLGPWPDVER